MKNQNEDDEIWRLTPWGCMYAVLKDYGYNPEMLTPKMGEHMVEDLMNLLITQGLASRVEEDE